jgi:hypothetical protein
VYEPLRLDVAAIEKDFAILRLSQFEPKHCANVGQVNLYSGKAEEKDAV